MEKRFSIVNKDVEKYIQETLAPLKGNLGEIHFEAVKEGIPVSRLEILRVLETICSIKRPDAILELGCAVGLTSIFFSSYLSDNGYIDTVENDINMVNMARSNIRKFLLDKKINVIYAEAMDYLININKKYDIIFIDAAKGQYERYFDICSNLLNDKGIIIADNVLYRGMVAKGDKVPHRQNTLVERLRSFLDKIAQDERFSTSILSVGDGLSISVKK
ncbi:MAG: O-methyltransferase [Clostridia bacterium]|jgi:predicted O-methyltransferase YrrM